MTYGRRKTKSVARKRKSAPAGQARSAKHTREKGRNPLTLYTVYCKRVLQYTVKAHVHDDMKNYFKHYSTADFAVMMILIAGIVVIDSTNQSMSGKVANTVLVAAVVITLLKGLIMMWREKRHERK